MKHHASPKEETNEAFVKTAIEPFIACLSAQAHWVSVPIGLILPFMTYYPMRPSLFWQPGKWLYWEETERRRTGKDWDGIELYVLFIGECFYSYLLLLQIKIQWQILWKSFQRKCLRFKCIFLFYSIYLYFKNRKGKGWQTYNLKCHPVPAGVNQVTELLHFPICILSKQWKHQTWHVFNDLRSILNELLIYETQVFIVEIWRYEMPLFFFLYILQWFEKRFFKKWFISFFLLL